MNKKILIVDDAPFMRMMVRDILTKNGYVLENGYEIVEAENGFDGVERYKFDKPALTIMDISMPVMDGIDATKAIMKIDGDAKIFMLSALAQPTLIAQSFIAGAVDFLAKPFQADWVVRFVQKHLTENVRLDIEEVKVWQAGDKPYDVVRKVQYDEAKFVKKLYEAVKECVDESSGLNWNELSMKLSAYAKSIINPITVPSDDKLTQDEINALVTRFTKG